MVRKGNPESYETIQGARRTIGSYMEISMFETLVINEKLSRDMSAIKLAEKKREEERAKKEEDDRLANERRLKEARDERLSLISDNAEGKVREFSLELLNFFGNDIAISPKPEKDELEKQADYEHRVAQWKRSAEKELASKFSEKLASLGITGNTFFMKVPGQFMIKNSKEYFRLPLRYAGDEDNFQEFTQVRYSAEDEELSIDIPCFKEFLMSNTIAVRFRDELVPDAKLGYSNKYTQSIGIPLSLPSAKALREALGGRDIDTESIQSLGISDYIFEISFDPEVSEYGYACSLGKRVSLRALIIDDKQ
jgi:hypothetical protein